MSHSRRTPSSGSVPLSVRHPRDEQGTISSGWIGSIPEDGQASPEDAQQRPPTGHLTMSSRSLNWPFFTRSRSPSASNALNMGSNSQRRNTSGTWGQGNGNRPVSSIFSTDIIPDYVVNYLRGETPETLARKRENRQTMGARQAHAKNHSKNHLSQMANLYDFAGLETQSPGSTGRKSGAGWRGGIIANIVLVGIILLAVIVCLVMAILEVQRIDGELTISEGTCTSVRGLDQGLHALVNVLGFILVAGANYAIQVLSSPTREEVDLAHQKGRWADIGIPSPSNLFGVVSYGRTALAAIIFIAALGSQVLYNALFLTKPLEGSSQCALVVPVTLLLVLAILFFIAFAALLITMFLPSFAPLATLGDAISSFLVRPDDHTAAGERWFVTRPEAKLAVDFNEDGEAGQGRCSWRWWSVPSRGRWSVWAGSLLLPLALAAGMLGLSMTSSREDTDAAVASTAFSFTRPFSTIGFPPLPHAGLAIITALPQVLLVLFYMTTNALLTVFSLSHELTQATNPSAQPWLRISSGRCNATTHTTTSLYLTLPRPYSWALFLLFAATGFFLSQSLTFVASDTSPALGLNPLSLVLVLGILSLVATLIFTMASLRRSSETPTVSNICGRDTPATGETGLLCTQQAVVKTAHCSAVVSSRCERGMMNHHLIVVPRLDSRPGRAL